MPKRGPIFFFFAKVRSKELKFCYILGAYELNFGPNLGCRAKNSYNFQKISLVRVKIYYFGSKWGSRVLSHAATADLKNGRRGVKRS